METRVVSGNELREIANTITRNISNDFNAATCIANKLSFSASFVLFTSDRITCCDEGVVFADDPERGLGDYRPKWRMAERTTDNR